MEIKKVLTVYNHNQGTVDRIRYIVMHYVGATGTAQQNCAYYASGQVGASAHYFVDFDGTVYQSVEDKNIAWHCGAKSYQHPECRNSNSIGIELCVRNQGDKSVDSNDWYFEDATVKSAIELVQMLMAKYNVPIDNVLRHYDVTSKCCPNPWVKDPSKWEAFKAALVTSEYTTGWHKDMTSGLWWYQTGTGKNEYYKNTIADIDGKMYGFGADGYMKQGEFTVKTDENGAITEVG